MESALPALLALQLAAGLGQPPPVGPIPLLAEPGGASSPSDPGRSEADLYYFTPEEADRAAKLFGLPRRDAGGWTFDDDVPQDIQEQMARDLAFIGSIEGGAATPLHREIFGELSGAAYKDFFDSRVSAIGVSGCGNANAVACVIPILGPSKLWITKNYVRFSHPQIARLMVVFHEARHTEVLRRNWPHARCPRPFRDAQGRDMRSIWTGAPLAGEPACDRTPLGSYGSSTIMLTNIRKSCVSCTDKVKMDAELYADDQFGRIIDADARRRMEEDLR